MAEHATRRLPALLGVVAASAVVALALSACGAGGTGGSTDADAATTGATAPSSGASASVSPTQTLPPLPASPAPLATSTTSPPVRVTIPAIGVNSTLDALGLNPNGSLQTPPTFPVAGWYSGGTRPGDPGPAIIAGHIDSYKGPAVFYDLHELKPGDPVTVTRADGSVLKFTVESSAQYPKSQFPTDAVYGPTPLPELKLITCTGVFDRSVRSYEDNLVVTAVLAS